MFELLTVFMVKEDRNKYVDFVSDEHFLKCVKHVYSAYVTKTDKRDMKRFTKNSLDMFKTLFDIKVAGLGVDEWMDIEQVRQADKTISNKVGEFHQMLLGGVDGWEDLGVGHPLGVDLKNKQETIFIELKNKHNTVTKVNLKVIFDKLKNVLDKYPKAIAYYAYIIPEKPNSGERVWKISHRDTDDRIREIWGFNLYELVTGDKNALRKVWAAIPKTLNDLSEGKQLSQEDIDKLEELFKLTFGS